MADASLRVLELHDSGFIELARAAEEGGVEARERLFVVMYDKLHRMAQRELRNHPGISLSPTTLLHETYLNFSQRKSASAFERSRFMVYAARAMRGLVIDYF